MYGSNITDSYGTISPNRNHTNETINAFRISSSGDIDGRNWIFTTGSYGIWKEYTSKFFQKWWLRSPYTSLNAFAWVVASSGIVGSYSHGGVGYYSYGRNADRRACTTPTLAVHGMCGRMVTPTMISMSTIPTGVHQHHLAEFIYVLQLYVFLCNRRRKYDYICSRIFLRVYPHKFKYHYREINSRLGHLWKERRE